MSFATAQDRVAKTLIDERTDVNWDLKLGGYTDFWRTRDYACRQLNSSTTPTRSSMEIEYYVEDECCKTSPAWCGGTSCAAGAGVRWSGPYSRSEYTDFKVWLRADLIRGDDYGVPNDRRRVVNHETGHVLGLFDGGPTSGNWDTSCPTSIMHLALYGCSNNANVVWPVLSTDHTSVNQIIAGQGP